MSPHHCRPAVVHYHNISNQTPLVCHVVGIILERPKSGSDVDLIICFKSFFSSRDADLLPAANHGTKEHVLSHIFHGATLGMVLSKNNYCTTNCSLSDELWPRAGARSQLKPLMACPFSWSHLQNANEQAHNDMMANSVKFFTQLDTLGHRCETLQQAKLLWANLESQGWTAAP